jgi:hypothetical protein
MSASHFPPPLFVDILPISISTAAVFEHIHLLSILFAEFERIPTDKPTWPFPVVVGVVPFSSFYSFLVHWFGGSTTAPFIVTLVPVDSSERVPEHAFCETSVNF